MLEPYDPDYLREDASENPCVIDREELQYFHKLSILTGKLRKHKIYAAWDGDFFSVNKMSASGYPSYRYVWVEDGEYCFGTLEKTLLSSKSIMEVIKEVEKFLL